MACYLRVIGESLDIDALLRDLVMKADRVWHRGEPRFRTKIDGEVHRYSGASFVASDADMSEFEVQMKEATHFLNQNSLDIERIVGFPGAEQVALDFGIELRDVAIHSDLLTPPFLKAAGALGIAVELSHYPCVNDEQES